MKIVIRWIVLVWSVLAIPYTFEAVDFIELFFGLLYLAVIIGLIVSDLREKKGKEK